MVRMRALRAFTDASTGRLVAEGQEFECTQESAERLAACGIVDAAAAKPAPAPKAKPARARTAKPRAKRK